MNARDEDCDIAVVGGGPAGLAAALAAHQCGARVALLDEYPTLGGQLFKQPARGLAHGTSRAACQGKDLIERVRSSAIHVLGDCLVWAARPGALYFRHRGTMGMMRCRAIVAACGAYERPAIFPGWELPGVMTPGGAQTLVKAQGCRPGARVVVAGCGPFLLPVATALLDAGASVLGVYELTRPRQWFKGMTTLLRHPARIGEAIGYWWRLRAAGVPLRFGFRVLEACGREALEEVRLVRCDSDGCVLPDGEVVVRADLLCASYGFVPAVQLTRLLGCEHHYRALRGGWVPWRDASLATSVPGVFVAGEAAGIGGAHAALAEGALAGMAAAESVGLQVAKHARARAVRTAKRQRAFGDLINGLFRVPEAVHCGIDDRTTVCRCEEVSAAEIRNAAAAWAPDVNMVKAVTRCGMGYCQGRICGPAVQSLVAASVKRAAHEVGSFRVRAPLKPVPAGALATYAEQTGMLGGKEHLCESG